MIYLNKNFGSCVVCVFNVVPKILDLISENKNLIFSKIIGSVMSCSSQGISCNLFTAIFVVWSRVA